MLPPTSSRFARTSRLARGNNLLAIAIPALIIVLQTGCRSQAHQDLYTDKMAARIRVLEDQLNQADYENMVLREKLGRQLQQNENQAPPSRPRLFNNSSSPDSSGESPQTSDPDADLSAPTLPEDFQLDIDPGVPVEDFVPPPLNLGDEPGASDLLPPPSQPVPPRAEDIAPPPIELGDPAPPSLIIPDLQEPPGRIDTPDSAQLLLPMQPQQPTELKLHPGLSGIHHIDSDDSADGLFLVITLIDQYGKPISTNQPITIVALDPAREDADARLARWEFDAEQVAKAQRTEPISSLQFPVEWQGKYPQGDRVAVFARMELAGGQRLQAELMIPINRAGQDAFTRRNLTHPSQRK